MARRRNFYGAHPTRFSRILPRKKGVQRPQSGAARFHRRRQIAIFKYLSNDVGQKFNTKIPQEQAEKLGIEAQNYEVAETSARL